MRTPIRDVLVDALHHLPYPSPESDDEINANALAIHNAIDASGRLDPQPPQDPGPVICDHCGEYTLLCHGSAHAAKEDALRAAAEAVGDLWSRMLLERCPMPPPDIQVEDALRPFVRPDRSDELTALEDENAQLREKAKAYDKAVQECAVEDLNDWSDMCKLMGDQLDELKTLRRAVGLAFTVAQATAMYDLDHNDLDLTPEQLAQCLEAAK